MTMDHAHWLIFFVSLHSLLHFDRVVAVGEQASLFCQLRPGGEQAYSCDTS